jgi:hypothetical protein
MTPFHPAWLDRIGMFGATLCALHCAAMPLLMLTVPLSILSIGARGTWQHDLARWVLRLHGYETILVSMALGLAAVSLVLGWLRHRRRLPMLLGVLAAASLGLGLGTPVPWPITLHLLLLVMGSLLLAAAHWFNLVSARRL